MWTRAEMQQLADAAGAGTDVLLISDEVYEHMVFDGAPHVSASSLPALAARAFVVSSFGKTYHVTGWKVGTVAAPAALTAEFRKVHQFNVFTVNTPMQHGAGALHGRPRALPRAAGLLPAQARPVPRRPRPQRGCALLPSEGTYFQTVDYSAVSNLPEAEFCQLAHDARSAWPRSRCRRSTKAASSSGIARLCFAKQDETLQTALQRLAKL